MENEKEEIILKYIEFINLINENSESKIDLNDNDDENKKKILLYFEEINNNQKYKKYLLERKVKLFYSEKLKLFDNINIKKILEKVSEENKEKIWTYLQLFYILSDETNSNYTLKLINNIEENIKENNVCDELMDDIFKNIKELFNNFNDEENPLEKIISISKTLSEKYSKDIEEGNITIEQLIKYINKYISENEINNDMFNNIDISQDKIMDMFNKLLTPEQIESFKNLSNINLNGNNSNLVNNLLKNVMNNNVKKISSEPLENDKLQNMEKYFENISTDNLDNISLNAEQIEQEENNTSDNNVSMENLTEMLFSQFSNINSKLSSSEKGTDLLNEDNVQKLDDLKNELMNQLTEEQRDEVTNLTNNIMKGFNIK